MIKQLTRGIIYFEDKKIEDVERVFANFRFDDAKFKFFNKIKINNTEVNFPGLLLNGKINEKYTSENVVRLFRKLMNLNIESKNCDISVEKEDEIEELTQDRDFENYLSFKVFKKNQKQFFSLINNNLKEEFVLKKRGARNTEGEEILSFDFFSDKDIGEIVKNILFENNFIYISSEQLKF